MRHGLGTQQSPQPGQRTVPEAEVPGDPSQKVQAAGRGPAEPWAAPLGTLRQEGTEIRGGRGSLARESESLHLSPVSVTLLLHYAEHAY